MPAIWIECPRTYRRFSTGIITDMATFDVIRNVMARSLCPYCGGDDVAEALLSPTGTLWAWTAVTAAPPGYQGEVPYGFGVVELPEGIRVLTRLTESDPGRLEFGQDVQLQLVALHKNDDGHDVLTWAFG